jgi:type IV secretory pathway TraG/TraD family ATPase VirD4
VPHDRGLPNLAQAISVHGKDKAESILSGAGTQIFLTPNDETTAGYISRRAGTRTTFDLQYDGWYWQPNGHGCGMPVYSQHDLYGFPRNKLIMFREGVSNAIEAYRTPYYKSALAKLAAPNPYAPPAGKAVKL